MSFGFVKQMGQSLRKMEKIIQKNEQNERNRLVWSMSLQQEQELYNKHLLFLQLQSQQVHSLSDAAMIWLHCHDQLLHEEEEVALSEGLFCF